MLSFKDLTSLLPQEPSYSSCHTTKYCSQWPGLLERLSMRKHSAYEFLRYW
jgi:hypothetical protein